MIWKALKVSILTGHLTGVNGDFEIKADLIFTGTQPTGERHRVKITFVTK